MHLRLSLPLDDVNRKTFAAQRHDGQIGHVGISANHGEGLFVESGVLIIEMEDRVVAVFAVISWAKQVPDQPALGFEKEHGAVMSDGLVAFRTETLVVPAFGEIKEVIGEPAVAQGFSAQVVFRLAAAALLHAVNHDEVMGAGRQHIAPPGRAVVGINASFSEKPPAVGGDDHGQLVLVLVAGAKGADFEDHVEIVGFPAAAHDSPASIGHPVRGESRLGAFFAAGG